MSSPAVDMLPSVCNDEDIVKIATNINFYTVAGIAQYLSNLVMHNERAFGATIFGINVMRTGESQGRPPFDPARTQHFRLIDRTVECPDLKELLSKALSLEDIRIAYRPVINAYLECIRDINPDCVIINGTYAMPWSLLQAALQWGRAQIVIHYHGILTKEVEHWADVHARALMQEMEKEFDVPGAFYVFPSELARRTVEQEVYRHPLSASVVIPNPVPEHFFDMKPKTRHSFSMGMVARWHKIKNIDVFLSLARYSKRKKENFSFPIITDLPAAHADYVNAASLLNFKEPVPHQNLPEFYKTLGVLLLPSRFETYGNVAQEALAAGTPVLVSAAAGVAETLHFVGLGAWVHDFSSAAQVFEAAARIAMSSVPIHARQLLQLSFSSGAVFKNYFKVLKELV